MPEISTEKRDQAMTLIRLYCNRPFCNHGKKRSTGPYKGWHLHDWGHVVQRVYRIFYDLPLDIPNVSVETGEAKGLAVLWTPLADPAFRQRAEEAMRASTCRTAG